jgi:hypothetical protein
VVDWGRLGWIGVNWVDCGAFDASTFLEGGMSKKTFSKQGKRHSSRRWLGTPVIHFIVSVETRLGSSLTPSQIFTNFKDFPFTSSTRAAIIE